MYECCPHQLTEIESYAELLEHIDAHGSLRHVVVQGLDLQTNGSGSIVRTVPAEDACFLGCRMDPEVETHIRETGGVVFPAFTGIPFHPYRASLYTPGELMDGYEPGRPESFSDTVDAQIYDYFTARRRNGRDVPVMDALAFRIHDHAIDDALRQLLHPDDGPSRRVVGIMGGHQLLRTADTYRTVATLAWRLARQGLFVATGGGPGAMEAANLGASLATYDRAAIDDAIETLSSAPHYEDDDYIERSMDVRDAYPDRTESLAVPTWFYGHEPSNLFSTHIAKYFANSIREDGLLAIATCGVVFAPGSAGTIQEVFMDAAQNHYETFGPASPMIFLDETYWTETKPVFPLLKILAEDAPHEDRLTATDDVDTVVQTIEDHAAVRGEDRSDSTS